MFDSVSESKSSLSLRMGYFLLRAGCFRLLGAAVEEAVVAFRFLVGGFAVAEGPSLYVDFFTPFFSPFPLSWVCLL